MPVINGSVPKRLTKEETTATKRMPSSSPSHLKPVTATLATH
jgi:hypothetical protein